MKTSKASFAAVAGMRCLQASEIRAENSMDKRSTNVTYLAEWQLAEWQLGGVHRHLTQP
jgi:hypothetical protein